MSGFSQKHYSLPPNNSGPGGLLGRIVAFIIGVGVLIVSLFVGAVFMAALVGFVLVIGSILAVRVWWLKRRMQQQAREHGDIEAEYTVVTEEKWTKR